MYNVTNTAKALAISLAAGIAVIPVANAATIPATPAVVNGVDAGLATSQDDATVVPAVYDGSSTDFANDVVLVRGGHHGGGHHGGGHHRGGHHRGGDSYRHHGHHGYNHHRHHDGWGYAAGVIGLGLGAAIANSATCYEWRNGYCVRR